MYLHIFADNCGSLLTCNWLVEHTLIVLFLGCQPMCSFNIGLWCLSLVQPNGRMTSFLGVRFEISGFGGSFELGKQVIVLYRSVMVTVAALFWTLLKTIMLGIVRQYVSFSTLLHRLILTNPTVLNCFVSEIGDSLPVFCQDAKYKSQKKNQDETKQARLSFSQHLIPPNSEMNIWCPLNQVFKPCGNGISSLVILLRWLDVRYKFCSIYVSVVFGCFWRL